MINERYRPGGLIELEGASAVSPIDFVSVAGSGRVPQILQVEMSLLA